MVNYCETNKTLNTRNISDMFLCCKENANQKKPKAEMLIGLCFLWLARVQRKSVLWLAIPQAAQTHYINADVTLACERCCVTNGYLQRLVWDRSVFLKRDKKCYVFK